MRLSSLAAVFVLLTAFASPAAAQLCAGNAEISRRSPIIVGGSLGKGDGYMTVAPAVIGGGEHFWVRATVDSTGFDNRDDRSLGVAGQVAGQFSSGRFHFCPVAGGGRTNGPDTDDYSSTTNFLNGGVLLGFIAHETANARIVPSLNLGASRSSSTFDWGPDFELGKATSSATQAAFGVGYVRKHFSIQPSVTLFFNDGDVSPAYYVEVYWAPGKR